MGEITELLHAARSGDGRAMNEVFALVYPTLRGLAGARMHEGSAAGERTISPTVLVHETYIKLIGAAKLDITDRHHFFACAARAMRQILIDNARSRQSQRRGSGKQGLPLAAADADQAEKIGEAAISAVDLLDLDHALDTLDEIDSGLRELVEMRVFAGLTLQQLADNSGRSLRSTNRDWQRARSLLLAQIA